MKETGNLSSIIDTLIANPYFWVILGSLSLIFFYIKHTNPKSIEWIDALLEFLGGLFLYMITFQWLTQSKDSTDRFFSFIMFIIIVLASAKVLYSFI